MEQPWSNHGHDHLWLMSHRPAIPNGAGELPPGLGGGYGLLFLLVAGENGVVVPVGSGYTIPLMHRSQMIKRKMYGRDGFAFLRHRILLG